MSDKITPEYIVEQSKILSEAELLQLIENYGEQEFIAGTYAESGGSY